MSNPGDYSEFNQNNETSYRHRRVEPWGWQCVADPTESCHGTADQPATQGWATTPCLDGRIGGERTPSLVQEGIYRAGRSIARATGIGGVNRVVVGSLRLEAVQARAEDRRGMGPV